MIIGYSEPLKLAKLVNGTTTTEPVLIPVVKLTKDTYAIQNGLPWEARFNHKKLGSVVIPYATEKEAQEARIKAN